MKIKSIGFKPGARLKTKITGRELYAELERVRAKCGLTSRTVLEEARPVKAKLHKEFTWEDEKAAEQWRLKEAGDLLNVLQVVYENGPAEPQRAIVVQERVEKENHYAPVHEVLQRRDSRDAIILSLLEDLQSMRRRFALVSELSHVVPVLDHAVEQVESAIASEGEDVPKKTKRRGAA